MGVTPEMGVIPEMRYCVEFFNWSCEIFSCFQVLQYNHEERTWMNVGTLERARYYHAIVEANLAVVCPAVGNLNAIKKGNQELGKSSSSSSPKASYSKHEHHNPYLFENVMQSLLPSLQIFAL